MNCGRMERWKKNGGSKEMDRMGENDNEIDRSYQYHQHTKDYPGLTLLLVYLFSEMRRDKMEWTQHWSFLCQFSQATRIMWSFFLKECGKSRRKSIFCALNTYQFSCVGCLPSSRPMRCLDHRRSSRKTLFLVKHFFFFEKRLKMSRI